MTRATITAVPNQPTMIVERLFKAAPEVVFAAMTRKDLVEKWWIGPGYTVDVAELTAKTGGTWRFIQTNESGHQFHFRGVFHLVTKPTGASPGVIIQTIEFEDQPEPGHAGLQKLVLESTGDSRTKMVSTGTFLSIEDRDMLIRSGMERGMNNSYEALDRLLAKQIL